MYGGGGHEEQLCVRRGLRVHAVCLAGGSVGVLSLIMLSMEGTSECGMVWMSHRLLASVLSMESPLLSSRLICSRSPVAAALHSDRT